MVRRVLLDYRVVVQTAIVVVAGGIFVMGLVVVGEDAIELLAKGE